jgi:hypothetical protein
MKIQTKDIPDEVMLDLVKSLSTIQRAYVDDQGFHSFKTSSASRFDIENLWPSVPPKVLQAKLKKLADQGLIEGCTCGCRGDFEVI